MNRHVVAGSFTNITGSFVTDDGTSGPGQIASGTRENM
jgi:hypothetical protein